LNNLTPEHSGNRHQTEACPVPDDAFDDAFDDALDDALDAPLDAPDSTPAATPAAVAGRLPRLGIATLPCHLPGMANDAHSRPAADLEEPLYDTSCPTPTHGERARTLVASVRTGTLCTIAKEPAGFPYGSFVTFALDGPAPVFFISTMAEHTRNLLADDRASLLVAEGGEDDPLANGRVTLLGRCRRLADGDERETAKAAYLDVHPNAAYYIDYRDFDFWRLDVDALRYIGGYGRMSWVEPDDWARALPDPIATHARGILDHMNADHADALVAYCHAFSKATDITEATMTGIDRYGFEMAATTAKGPRPVRLAFDAPIATAEDARRELVALLGRARAQA
jgi:putative heme iron utilization protein